MATPISILKSIATCALLLCATSGIFAQKGLESPYYIYPRSGGQHIDLSADWLLTSTSEPKASIDELKAAEWFGVEYPTSVQMANYKAGKLGDPYAHLNAREHEKLEQRVWYYRKEFTLPEQAKGANTLLNFDGIDYYAKIWLNDSLLGVHRGISGGPTVDIGKYARFGEKNELLVEVKSANYRQLMVVKRIKSTSILASA
jgi:beta-mannosidase